MPSRVWSNMFHLFRLFVLQFEQTDEMMTMEEPQQQIHAHVVEEILPHELTEVVTTDVKDVISQYLPTRKRKPRAKKPNNGMFNTFWLYKEHTCELKIVRKMAHISMVSLIRVKEINMCNIFDNPFLFLRI